MLEQGPQKTCPCMWRCRNRVIGARGRCQAGLGGQEQHQPLSRKRCHTTRRQSIRT